MSSALCFAPERFAIAPPGVEDFRCIRDLRTRGIFAAELGGTELAINFVRARRRRDRSPSRSHENPASPCFSVTGRWNSPVSDFKARWDRSRAAPDETTLDSRCSQNHLCQVKRPAARTDKLAHDLRHGVTHGSGRFGTVEQASKVMVLVSDADIAMDLLGVAFEVDAGARPYRAALLDDIVPVGEALQHLQILVGDEDQLARPSSAFRGSARCRGARPARDLPVASPKDKRP